METEHREDALVNKYRRTACTRVLHACPCICTEPAPYHGSGSCWGMRDTKIPPRPPFALHGCSPPRWTLRSAPCMHRLTQTRRSTDGVHTRARSACEIVPDFAHMAPHEGRAALYTYSALLRGGLRMSSQRISCSRGRGIRQEACRSILGRQCTGACMHARRTHCLFHHRSCAWRITKPMGSPTPGR